MALVDVCEENMRFGESGVEAKCVEGAALGLSELTSRELHETEAIFSDGGGRRRYEATVDERLSLAEFGMAIENHRESEQRRSKAAIREVDRLLEIGGRVIELAEMRFGEAEVVVGGVIGWREFDDRPEVRKAGLRIAFKQKRGVFF